MIKNNFDNEMIGSVMSENFISVTPDMTVKQAMRALVKQAAECDNIYDIYVTDDTGTYYGLVNLKDLIIARETTEFKSLISYSYPYVYADELIDDCVDRLHNCFRDSIPVLNRDDKLLGIITAQTIVKLLDDEMSEDYVRLGGLTSEEDINVSTTASALKRLPWLLILLVLGLVVSTVVGFFESVIAELTVIICFQSLILGMAGNTATQSLAVTIRILTDDNLSFPDKLKLVVKEVRIGALVGLALSLVSFITVGLFVYYIKLESFAFSFAVSGCISAALVISMTVASFTGTIVPILFQRLKIDPAVASGPLITTLNDLVAVVTYYGIAWLLLIKI